MIHELWGFSALYASNKEIWIFILGNDFCKLFCPFLG